MQHTQCPSCSSEKIEAFYSIKNAPIFSLVTVASKDEALVVPRKDIELGFCHACGFIFNRLFDTNIDYFTDGYEDQQGFSKTFMQYLTRISKELIEKYDLKHKTLMEIGCGKGDFINLLVELSDSKGIGVDPAYQEGRQNNPKLTFHNELYALKHGGLPIDFICCRHTFEHIHATAAFLRLIRKSIGEKSQPIVFFEVPEVRRILDIQAFWDIYYEHCSYFSPGSLARVFRSTGFEVLDVRLDYNDQYLLLEAKPTQSISAGMFAIEESVQELSNQVSEFKMKVEKQLTNWRNRLTEMKEKKRKTVIWGGGSKSVGFLTKFADLDLIEYVVDINPNMEGNYIPGIGKMYVQPGFLQNYQPDDVIIMNDVYRDEITKTLHDMSVYPDVYAL